MSQFSGEEKVQMVVVAIMLFTVIRVLMSMPMKLRIIIIVSIITFLTFNWYMVNYQEELVNQFRNFLNMGELRSNK